MLKQKEAQLLQEQTERLKLRLERKQRIQTLKGKKAMQRS
jgi:hypothetical protein